MTEQYLGKCWEAYAQGGKKPWILSLAKELDKMSMLAKKSGAATIYNLQPKFQECKENIKFFHLENSNKQSLHVQIKENEETFQKCFDSFEQEILDEKEDSKTHGEKYSNNNSVLPPMEQDINQNYAAAPPIAKVKQAAGNATKGHEVARNKGVKTLSGLEPISLKKNVTLTKKPKIMTSDSESSTQDSTSDSSAQTSACDNFGGYSSDRDTKPKSKQTSSLLPPITTTTTSSPSKTGSIKPMKAREGVATSSSSSSSSSSKDLEGINRDFLKLIITRAESGLIKVHDERVLSQKIANAVASGFSEATVCDVVNLLMTPSIRKEFYLMYGVQATDTRVGKSWRNRLTDVNGWLVQICLYQTPEKHRHRLGEALQTHLMRRALPKNKEFLCSFRIDNLINCDKQQFLCVWYYIRQKRTLTSSTSL